MKKLTKKQFKTQVNKLVTICLERSDTYQVYDDEDLMNASLIFTHIFGDVLFTENQHLCFEDRCKVATLAGEAFREFIKVSIGKDMAEVARKTLNIKK